MMSPRKPSNSNSNQGQQGKPPSRDPVGLGLLAAFVAVCVARPLVPSEAVSWLGDGHPFTVLLLVIAGGYLLQVLRRGRFARSFHPVDAAVAALVLLCVVSSALGLFDAAYGIGGRMEFGQRDASPRLAINMIWEWIGLGLVYFLARQLIATSLESRALVSVMIALAVVLSAFGLYQVLVTLPAQQAAYAADPDEVLRRLGEWFPPGSPERARFEDRLGSTEPLATFALANSLAGYLTPWLLVAVGVTWSIMQSRGGANPFEPRSPGGGGSLLRLAGLAVGIATILVCLVLTKSRSAYLALGVGLVLLPLVVPAFRRVLSWRAIAMAGVVLALAIGLAAATGRLDVEVFSEASKSLGYRAEYWQATLDLIANYPLFGVGPGEFQDYYTQYKLPQASEEIRDPHNFLLEVWATGGTLAFMALVALLALSCWQSWELSVPAESSSGVPADADASRSTMRFVASGAAAGMLLALGVGPTFGFYWPVGQLVVGLAIGAALMAILWPWALAGKLPLRLPALGLLVLAVHLLAAGGFTFPGVAGTFWILMALGVNQRDDAPPAVLTRRLVPAVALGFTIAAVVGCYYTALYPVLRCRAATLDAFQVRLSDEGRYNALQAASRADPYSAEPWRAIGQLCVKHLKQDPKSDRWGTRFVQAVSGMIQTQRHSSSAWREVAGWYREVYGVDPNADLAGHVLRFSRGAATLYPNSARIQAELALALEAAGNAAESRVKATRALELDSLTPHADKKLSAEVRARIERLRAESEDP